LVFCTLAHDISAVFDVLCSAKDETRAANLPRGSISANIATTIACVLAATAALSWLAIGGISYLPALYVNVAQQARLASYIDVLLWALNIATFVLLFVRRRTILDFWLMIVLFAWWPNFVVAAFYTVVRFSAGWYLARVVALLASSTRLIVLLVESAALYGRLTNAYLLLRRERANRLAGVEAATAAMAHELRQPLTGIAAQGAAGLNWLHSLGHLYIIPPWRSPQVEKRGNGWTSALKPFSPTFWRSRAKMRTRFVRECVSRLPTLINSSERRK
jgi:signal transduction histidine kinase